MGATALMTVEGTHADTELGSSGLAAPALTFEDRCHEALDEVVTGLVERPVEISQVDRDRRRVRRAIIAVARRARERESVRSNLDPVCEHGGSTHRRAKLAHVSGPPVLQQRAFAPPGQGMHR
jgi:hypothetical protein